MMNLEKNISNIENHPRLREVLLGQMDALRSWNSDIPLEMKTSISPDNQYKVRKAWWTGLIGAFENATSSGLVREPILYKKIQQFIDDYTAPERLRNPRALTTRQDIERAEALMEEVYKNIN